MIKKEQRHLSNKLICCLGASCFAILLASVTSSIQNRSFSMSKVLTAKCSVEKVCPESSDIQTDLDTFLVESNSLEVFSYIEITHFYQGPTLLSEKSDNCYIRGPPAIHI